MAKEMSEEQRQGVEMTREQEKELITKNAFEFLKRDDLILKGNIIKLPLLKSKELQEDYAIKDMCPLGITVDIRYIKNNTTYSALEYTNTELMELFYKTLKELQEKEAQQTEQQPQDIKKEELTSYGELVKASFEMEETQEKELIINNAMEFLKTDSFTIDKSKVYIKQIDFQYTEYETHSISIIDNEIINILFYKDKKYYALSLPSNEYTELYNAIMQRYNELLKPGQLQQEQAEHQDYYINAFYKFIKQDDLVAGFENETKFIMSSDKNLSNSKIKKICLDNNELIAYFENYMFTFKDNYSIYDDFLFKFNELLNKQKGEVEKLAELDVKDTIRKIEENTTRKSFFADCIKKEFNQPQETTDYTIKYDQNKPKLSQFPREAMEAVVEVMEYGARKYGGGTWSRVEAQRYVDAAARHLYAMQDIDENGREFINFSKVDEESGLEHLYHLACNVVYAVALYRRGKDETR